MNVANDGEMFACGLEILSEGEDVRPLRGEILHGGEDFVLFFAQAEHQTGLGGDVRMSLLGAMEKFERPLIERAFAHLAIEARDRFGVVIEHVGSNRENCVECVPVAAKIWD